MWRPGIVAIVGLLATSCMVQTVAVDGTPCWDLDGDGLQDPAEDVNADGLWNALDCSGPLGPAGLAGKTGDPGPAGSSCWDVDGDGMKSTAEDTNMDGVWNALDCVGPAGPPGDNQWLSTPTGIYYPSGSVSIGTPDTKMLFEVAGPMRAGHEIRMTNPGAPAEQHTWRTYVDSASWYVGTMDDAEGSEDIAISASRSGLDVTSVDITADLGVTGNTAFDGKVRMGSPTSSSKLTVEGSVTVTGAGDVYVSDATRGIILRSPSGNCFRLKVADGGNLVTEQAGCPQ